MSAPVSSTRADWAGACGAALAPIAQALKAQVLHADESPITILARRGEKTRGYGPMHLEEVDASKYVLAKGFSKLGGALLRGRCSRSCWHRGKHGDESTISKYVENQRQDYQKLHLDLQPGLF